MKPTRKVRRSQTISPFGVGAIMDILGESFIAQDASRWDRADEVRAPRVAADLRVDQLRTPRDANRDGSVPYYRFPQSLFCGRCRQMTRWSVTREERDKPPRCATCAGRPQLVPMRFVAVCGDGHVSDVDWSRWAHSRPTGRSQRQCGVPDLQFQSVKGVGGGLESLQVYCRTCEAVRNLRDLVLPGALAQVGGRCTGRQPWQPDGHAVTCHRSPVVLQRGASSVYFPEIVSALDIPPDSDWSNWGAEDARIRANDNFKLLVKSPHHIARAALIATVVMEEQVDEAKVVELLTRQGADDGHAPSHVDPAAREWYALTQPREDHDPRDNFIARRGVLIPPDGHERLRDGAPVLDALVSGVTLVERLREIRVLKGFRRHTMDRLVPANFRRPINFLPAIEVFGEGVFLSVDEDQLSGWSRQPGVVQRCEALRKRFSDSFWAGLLRIEVTPRLLLLHTLAHLLIRQMSFAAGYSSSSIRERLFAAEGGTVTPAMAGILLYTAAGDAEGTLGGLVRLGQPDRLVPVVTSAIDNARWCSLDPVCREATAQGPQGLSLASCHACTLTAETSCVLNNLLLDRMLLVDPQFGFLRELQGRADEGGTR